VAKLLKPGTGILLYHQFLEGNIHPTGEEHVLKSGELARLFGHECDILRDEELAIEDGRRLTFFVARRKPDCHAHPAASASSSITTATTVTTTLSEAAAHPAPTTTPTTTATFTASTQAPDASSDRQRSRSPVRSRSS
ncbi:unnamed protein product, partial [Polarella glacialis]